MPNLRYLYDLVHYCVRKYSILLFATVLGLVSVLIELVAITSLMPLMALASGSVLSAEDRWLRVLLFLGVNPGMRSFLVLFAALLALSVITQFANKVVASYCSKRIQADLSSETFSTVIHRFSLRDIEEKSIGHFISLAGDETARAGAMVVMLNQLLSAGFLAVLYFGTIFYFSVWVGLAISVFLIVSLLSLGGSFRMSHRLGHRLTEIRRIAYSVFMDSLNGLRSVRAYAAEHYVANKYHDVIHAYTATAFRIELLNQLTRSLPALLLLICLGFAAGLVLSGDGAVLDLAFLVTVLALLLRFFPSAGQCLNLALQITSESKAAKSVTDIVARVPESGSGANQSRVICPPISEINVIDLAFSHRTKTVFNGLSLRLTRGHSYAVVGPSGSGKSTLFDLLLAFYDPDDGEILIDGTPIGQFRPKDLREHVLLLGQQPTIFNDTVSKNICFGREATRSQVEHACHLASLDEVVAGLPGGIDTVVSYQGGNLSGGQCQRIGLARALLRQPQVLLLDESTSAVDRATRDKLVSGILDEYRDRIVVFSTHDLEIARMVDEVIELRPGMASGPQAEVGNAHP